MNTDINIPLTPLHMMGNEPNLDILEKFVVIDNEYDRGVNQYVLDTESLLSDGKYYLYGQLKLDKSTPITQQKMEEAIKINGSRLKDYGGPCNSFEAASIQKHEADFHSLLKLIEKYYRVSNIPTPPSSPTSCCDYCVYKNCRCMTSKIMWGGEDSD